MYKKDQLTVVVFGLQDVQEGVVRKATEKKRAIARRQTQRFNPKNGAEVLFGVLYPTKKGG